MADRAPLGFIGTGVMGEPMARNLAQKCGRPVLAWDPDPAPLERLAAAGVGIAADADAVARAAEVVFLSLPGGPEVEQVAAAILPAMTAGQTLVDTSTAPVALARDLAVRARDRGIGFADAPVARTRAAAEAGTLAVTVGSDAATFAAIEPHLRCFAEAVTHCGDAGAGQAAKILNNMVLFQTVRALAEALLIARGNGFDADVLFRALSQGSADSFALRNHGMKALLPGEFPQRAFSARYALKDLSYALEMARDAGLDAKGARLAGGSLQAAIDAGHGDDYWPVIVGNL